MHELHRVRLLRALHGPRLALCGAITDDDPDARELRRRSIDGEGTGRSEVESVIVADVVPPLPRGGCLWGTTGVRINTRKQG